MKKKSESVNKREAGNSSVGGAVERKLIVVDITLPWLQVYEKETQDLSSFSTATLI